MTVDQCLEDLLYVNLYLTLKCSQQIHIQNCLFAHCNTYGYILSKEVDTGKVDLGNR